MTEVIIRRYRRRDRDAVLRITETSFGGFCLDTNMDDHFGHVANTTGQERKRDAVDYDLHRNSEDAIVAELDGEVAGFVCTRIYRDLSIGHVANLAVAEDFQGRGIGKMLIRAALDHFRDRSMRYARIETLEQNERARKLYPQFGLREVGRQVYYMQEL